MTRTTAYRSTLLAVGFAALALFAATSSASAKLPSVGAHLNAGELSVGLDSDALQGKVNGVVRGQAATVRRQLDRTARSLRRSERKLRGIEHKLGSETYSATSATTHRLERLRKRTLRRVHSLSRRVRRLSRRVARYAIAEAREATNGSWLLVSRTGRILEQSGGISVDHTGLGQYRVSWNTSHESCFGLAAGGTLSSPLGSTVHVDPIGVGAMAVSVAAASGPKNLGFYLAASC